MKIAVIGGGVSGLTCAYRLNDVNDVTLFEANAYAGGHTDTHNLQVEGKTISVDTGFIVFNEQNYPNFTQMLRELDVHWQNSDMSFSVVNEQINLTYGAEGLSRLFAQKRNILKPSFYQMLWDLRRFYKEAPSLLNSTDDGLTLGDFLDRQNYSQAFIDGHILPMASALWSASSSKIRSFPAKYFVAFMDNHRMLQVEGRPQWLTVKGGSNQYVQALMSKLGNNIRLDTPVQKVRREHHQVEIVTASGVEYFDSVVFACHSNQALALLEQPTKQETSILGSIPFQKNIVTLHSDIRQMPKEKAAWASWNAHIPLMGTEQCRVSYWMNLLQDIDCKTPLIVTLNGQDEIDPKQVFAERTYYHPEYTPNMLAAQKRRSEINGQHNSFFCGAYWGWGFHEDGVKSALDVVDLISGVDPRVSA